MNDNMTEQNAPKLDSVEDLLSYAFALEQEACDRYEELGELMAAHNNREVSELFKKMAKLEQHHADEIRELMEQKNVKESSSIQYQWSSPEGPETIDLGDLHYLMTPHQALNLALHNEERAFAFFDKIAKSTNDEETRSLAEKFAEEETEHVKWVMEWLTKQSAPEKGWDEDDDPPNLQD
jgi:rubrerythrin